MLPGDQLPPDANYLMQRLANLEREVRELRAARSAEATTIGAGGQTITGGFLRMLHAGVEIVFIGRDANNTPIFRLRYPDGNTMFFTYLITGEGWYFAWCDQQGNILVSSDAISGQGLARPYIPIPWYPRDDQYSFYSTTISTSFQTCDEVRWVKQHPIVNLVMSTKTSDGVSTGSWQVLQDGITVVASGSIAATGTGVSVRFAVTGSHMSPLSLDVQLKRNTGAGSVGALIKSVTGEQS